MACDNCYNSSCTSTCGCPQQVKGTCVFYQGANLDCLDVTKGDTYDSILATLNDLICNLNPPSGLVTVVGSESVIVTSSTHGGTTTYTLAVKPSILTDITNNTNDIATLSSCVDAGVLNVISNDGSVTITVDTPSTGCGRILDLSIPAPSGTTTYDGIIYNNTTKTGTTGGTGEKILKTFPHNYIQYNLLDVGDEIRIRATGQVIGEGLGGEVDSVKFQLINQGGSPLWEKTFNGFNPVNKQSWLIDATLTATDVNGGDGLLNIEFVANSVLNGTAGGFATNSSLIVNADVSGIDYTKLVINVIYIHDSTSGDTINFARQLMVEVRKTLI